MRMQLDTLGYINLFAAAVQVAPLGQRRRDRPCALGQILVLGSSSRRRDWIIIIAASTTFRCGIFLRITIG